MASIDELRRRNLEAWDKLREIIRTKPSGSDEYWQAQAIANETKFALDWALMDKANEPR